MRLPHRFVNGDDVGGGVVHHNIAGASTSMRADGGDFLRVLDRVIGRTVSKVVRLAPTNDLCQVAGVA